VFKADEASTSPVLSPIPILASPDEASVEFGVVVSELLTELEKNKSENLKKLKTISCSLTLKRNPTMKVFADREIEAIQACDSIDVLLNVKLRHCYRWDDYSMLRILMSSLIAKKSLKLLEKFENKLDSKMKLQQIAEHCSNTKASLPSGYQKMVAIVKKDFYSISKKEYDKLKQFTSQHCGVEPHVICPFSKASPFDSFAIEWFISASVVSYAITKAKRNVQNFSAKMFVYLKISSTVIFDHRDNVRFYNL